MTAEEYSLLERLCKDLQMSKTAVILKGIRELSAKNKKGQPLPTKANG